MVDLSDIGRINDLYAEANSIDSAVAGFDAGGSIVALVISYPSGTGSAPSGSDQPDVSPVTIETSITVSTRGMQYPPQMVDTIKGFLTTRRAAINNELAQLGVTGV